MPPLCLTLVSGHEASISLMEPNVGISSSLLAVKHPDAIAFTVDVDALHKPRLQEIRYSTPFHAAADCPHGESG